MFVEKNKFGVAVLAADLVDTTIPFLLPKESLSKMSAAICSKSLTLSVHGFGSIRLQANTAGHMILPFDIISPRCSICPPVEKHIYPAMALQYLSSDQLGKIHYHLGHANLTSMMNTLNAAGETYDRNDLVKILKDCSRMDSRPRISTSIAHSHRDPFPGFTIYIDVAYLQPLTGHSRPYFFSSMGSQDSWYARYRNPYDRKI